jgi:hypothetical protein
MNKRITALSKHTGVMADQIAAINKSTFSIGADVGAKDYIVLTDGEADKQAAQCIKDSLWAFRPSFLIRYTELPAECEEMIRSWCEDKCEGANNAMLALIGFNLDRLIADAIKADGRGHFMSSYDGQEHRVGKYYIYRTN